MCHPVAQVTVLKPRMNPRYVNLMKRIDQVSRSAVQQMMNCQLYVHGFRR